MTFHHLQVNDLDPVTYHWPWSYEPLLALASWPTIGLDLTLTFIPFIAIHLLIYHWSWPEDLPMTLTLWPTVHLDLVTCNRPCHCPADLSLIWPEDLPMTLWPTVHLDLVTCNWPWHWPVDLPLTLTMRPTNDLDLATYHSPGHINLPVPLTWSDLAMIILVRTFLHLSSHGFPRSAFLLFRNFVRSLSVQRMNTRYTDSSMSIAEKLPIPCLILTYVYCDYF